MRRTRASPCSSGPFPPVDYGVVEALWYNLPGQAFQFFAGVAAWMALRRLEDGPGRHGAWTLLGIGMATIAALLGVFVRHGETRWQGADPLGFALFEAGLAVGFAIIVVALARLMDSRRLPPTLAFAAAFCGQISYGAYLFHNASPLLLARLAGPAAGASAPLCIGLTVAVAWLLHHGIEAPARNWGRRLA